jgi:hypothetical protein
MQPSTIDDLLTVTVLMGIFLSVANLVVSVVNGRSSQMAQLKATSDLRSLYERTYRRTPFISRRFAAITRPGKIERRGPPSDGSSV